jgi:hypothetical protein
MKTNVGGLDRVLRIVVGVVFLAAVVILEGNARWLGLIGLVPLLTGLFGYCPAASYITMPASIAPTNTAAWSRPAPNARSLRAWASAPSPRSRCSAPVRR